MKNFLCPVDPNLSIQESPGQDVKFTYGKVSGTIGVGNDEEPLNFVGDRVLLYNDNFLDFTWW